MKQNMVLMPERGFTMPYTKIKPRLKPYSEIVETLARMTKDEETNPNYESEEITEDDILDARFELDARLKDLNIPKIAVVIYVNWASHNVLTYSEIAEETKLTIHEIKIHLQTIKRRFPHLFLWGPHPPNKGTGIRGCGQIDADWIESEERRLLDEQGQQTSPDAYKW